MVRDSTETRRTRPKRGTAAVEQVRCVIKTNHCLYENMSMQYI